MKPNQEDEQDRVLNKVLGEWVFDAPLPPRFQEQVWQRISRTAVQAPPPFWASLSGLLERVLPRPKFAFAYLSVLLALGVAAGSVAAQIRTSHLDSELRQRYVQSVVPDSADTSHP